MSQSFVSIKELRAKYNVSEPTFLKILLGIPELNYKKRSKLLTPKQVKIIEQELD